MTQFAGAPDFCVCAEDAMTRAALGAAEQPTRATCEGDDAEQDEGEGGVAEAAEEDGESEIEPDAEDNEMQDENE